MAAQLQGIGPYRLLEVLAEGERVTVYRAALDGEGELAQPLVLKVLHKPVAADEAEVAAFLARAEAARALTHPAVVAVTATGTADGRPWVAAELVDGVSLAALYDKRGRVRLQEAVAAAALAQLLEALSATQRDADLVHGRLDAGAVLVDRAGNLRIEGFGAEGAAETDLIAVAELAQTLTAAWPPAVDAWLDRLQHGDQSFADPAAALEAFPLQPDDAAREAARVALKRRVKRYDKKRERERQAADAPAAAPARAPRSKSRRRAATREQRRRGRDKPITQELVKAARQARGVVWLCALLLLTALVVEVFRYAS